MAIFSLNCFRAMARATLFAIGAIAYVPVFAYSTSPTASPETANAVDGEQIDAEERIILPPAPEREERQGYQNLEIRRDLSVLPTSVATTRQEILVAAKSGDVEMLRPIIKRQANPPVVSFGIVPDPIAHLRESSNDGEGRELLAIMIELMEAPFSIIPAQNNEPEIYVWPAYATNDLEALTPTQLIDVYKIVSHQDLEEMQLFGGWYFFRVGIDSNGEWRYFVAGD